MRSHQRVPRIAPVCIHQGPHALVPFSSSACAVQYLERGAGSVRPCHPLLRPPLDLLAGSALGNLGRAADGDAARQLRRWGPSRFSHWGRTSFDCRHCTDSAAHCNLCHRRHGQRLGGPRPRAAEQRGRRPGHCGRWRLPLHHAGGQRRALPGHRLRPTGGPAVRGGQRSGPGGCADERRRRELPGRGGARAGQRAGRPGRGLCSPALRLQLEPGGRGKLLPTAGRPRRRRCGECQPGRRQRGRDRAAVHRGAAPAPERQLHRAGVQRVGLRAGLGRARARPGQGHRPRQGVQRQR
ncbi:hypothetical protein D9M68_658980 [compost metagenome]